MTYLGKADIFDADGKIKAEDLPESPMGPSSNGLSAYELAVQEGFIGTLQEWLTSLEGTDGYTPQKGIDYFDGSDASVTKATVEAVLTGEIVSHTHGYEPVNANIQAHISSAHAPSNAQKNSDITKAEIEAKLTGTISSHSHTGGADPFLAKLVLAGDISTGANVTPVTLTNMIFNFDANSKYVIDMYMMVSSAAATTGCGFQIDVSAAVTQIALSFTHQLANTGTLSGGSSIADDASVGVSSGVPTLNTITPIYGGGLLITGANAGTATFRFRSETTAVTTCKGGSMIRVMKMV